MWSWYCLSYPVHALTLYSRKTAVAFAFVERLMQSPDVGLAVASAMSTLDSTLLMLERAGFQRLVFEDFYEVFASLVENIIKPDQTYRTLQSNPEMLLEAFQQPEGIF
jgi:ubiquitin thioesterase protein OTUB1